SIERQEGRFMNVSATDASFSKNWAYDGAEFGARPADIHPASLPGLTRQSIFMRKGWTRGSSPRVTRKEAISLIGISSNYAHRRSFLSRIIVTAAMSIVTFLAPAAGARAGGTSTGLPVVASLADARIGSLLLRDGEQYVEAPRLATDIDITVSGP